MESTLPAENLAVFNNGRAVGFIVMMVRGSSFKTGSVTFSCGCSTCGSTAEFQVFDRGSAGTPTVFIPGETANADQFMAFCIAGKVFAVLSDCEKVVRTATDRFGV